MNHAGDLLLQIESARRRFRQERPAEDLDGVLGHLIEGTRRILREHEGMADELLGLYEQLGAVFEIARKLPQIREEREVVDLLCATIEETYTRYELGRCWVGADGSLDLCADGWTAGTEEARRWLLDVIAGTTRERRVMTREIPTEFQGAKVAQLLTAPVTCNGQPICVVLLGRASDGPELRASDMGLVEVLTTFCGDLIANIRLHHELRQISVDLVRSLVCTIDQKDPYTSGHSLRVGYYAKRLGEELGIKGQELQMLEWSALLHDVGKIGIRDDVLKKPGKLTDEEFAHIKEHPVRSYDVVKRVPQLRSALDGIRHHHERYDGKGYPDGLAGEGIPLQARIIQVADIFDALTSSRAYRKAFDWEKALSIIAEESGTVVDPELGRVFIRMIRREFQGKPEAWEAMTRYGSQKGDGSVPSGGDGDRGSDGAVAPGSPSGGGV
ncbi:MAG: HD-GYP domain-containing protein [Phycisphaerae bacterium]|nr:MAG: HD-GYP domain-containing protein [Planctomycetota bacterium]KAB2949946.1 MAG: HD-GYP domain-containing protein [Phycisphaerae bacterium]MBE7458575.1 HD-GYP domain-containing protein [Planctomycetia bacterium]MCK6465032.1 HD-GYP domain-containing protein [Phycisphaerae bacterium]MCL4718670.1 HD-GYP domain-containing protein [Phycisphaerae bacterium]